MEKEISWKGGKVFETVVVKCVFCCLEITTNVGGGKFSNTRGDSMEEINKTRQALKTYFSLHRNIAFPLVENTFFVTVSSIDDEKL